jgi:hypothetical protein
MVNYNLGKVYKIEPMSGGEEGDVYIGSTAVPYLSTRMALHRSSYKRWKKNKAGLTTVYKLFDKYGVTNCQITLVESVNATTKEELQARERHWIQSQTCVNKYVVGRTLPQYRNDNKAHISEKKREWKEANKEKIQQYNLDNRVHRLEKIREWREANNEHITQYRRQYYIDNKSSSIKSSSIV